MNPRLSQINAFDGSKWLFVWTLVGALVAATCAVAGEAPAEAETPPKPTTITTGSGEQYQTTVHRKTEGELSAEDFRQVSLLASRVVNHLNKAVEQVTDERADEARSELKQAASLVKVVRELLPTTVVTTVVKDAGGKEVYRCVDRVQDDRIPLYEGMVAVEVVEPVADAKEDAAEIRGVRLADADLLHTSVHVELGYVERKVNRAVKLLDEKPDEALAELVLAQTRGVTFAVNKEDNPLVAAQRALQLAERMVKQERLEAARANLQLAKNHLEVYRGLITEGEAQEVRQLEKDITRLQGEMERKDTAKKIREFWDRVAGWFTERPGEAQKTVEKAEEE